MTTKKKEKDGATTTNAELNFSIADISTIMEMLRANDVYEFCIERGDDKLWLKRTPEVAPADNRGVSTIVTTPIIPAAATATPTKAEPSAAQVKAEPAQTTAKKAEVVISAEEVEGKPAVKLHEIISPMVGTFYRRPAVDADPYVQVGDTVKKGDVLCIIEAMKIMNEIEADVAGRVVEICVEDGQMAEYGEVLVKIEKA